MKDNFSRLGPGRLERHDSVSFYGDWYWVWQCPVCHAYRVHRWLRLILDDKQDHLNQHDTVSS